MTAAPEAEHGRESLADVSHRLFDEFGSHASLAQIVAMLRQCQNELDSVRPDSMPEMVERLARQRLRSITPATVAVAGVVHSQRGHR